MEISQKSIESGIMSLLIPFISSYEINNFKRNFKKKAHSTHPLPAEDFKFNWRYKTRLSQKQLNNILKTAYTIQAICKYFKLWEKIKPWILIWKDLRKECGRTFQA